MLLVLTLAVLILPTVMFPALLKLPAVMFPALLKLLAVMLPVMMLPAVMLPVVVITLLPKLARYVRTLALLYVGTKEDTTLNMLTPLPPNTNELADITLAPVMLPNKPDV